MDEYLRIWNATEAYHKAHPKASRETCRVEGSKTLTKPNISIEIERRLNEIAMTTDEVLARLARHARGSHEPWMKIDEDGYVHLDFSSEEAKQNLDLIKKIKTKRTRRVEGHGEDAEQWEDKYVEIELVDSQNALLQLGKYHQLFAERVKVDMPLSVVGLTVLLDKVYGNGSNPGS